MKWIGKKIEVSLPLLGTVFAAAICGTLLPSGSGNGAVGGAEAGAAERKWIKLEAKAELLRNPLAAVTPAVFHPGWARRITLVDGGKPADLLFPHEGVDKQGKARPPIRGDLRRGMIWVDGNGNGKAERGESLPFAKSGFVGPFHCAVSFDDGTAATYSFYLQRVRELAPVPVGGVPRPAYEFRVLRAEYRRATFKGKTLLFFDDDGNGRYDDDGREALVVGSDPVTLVGKHIILGGKFYELLVHPAGKTIELRPARAFPLGRVELFRRYTPPQKSLQVRIPTVIIKGREGYFSFSNTRAFAARELPPGAYDFVVGLFQHKREKWLVKPGERTSFVFTAGQTVAPPWGAPLEAKFELASTGREVVASAPKYLGVAGEEYVPLSRKIFPERIYGARIVKDDSAPRMNLEVRLPLGNPRTYKVREDGTPAPVVFEVGRSDILEFTVEYKSGIMGVIRTRQRVSFIFRRKR